MLASALGVTVGLALLIGGGALLVHGASQIAASFGVSPMVVGLTIVGFGTSAPELVVNVAGSLDGQTGLAWGNVVGSNISNLSLLLGAAALFQTITIRGELVLREIPLLILGTAAITAMVLDNYLDGTPSVLSRSDAFVLLLLFGIFLYITAIDFVRGRQGDPLLTHISESSLVPTPEPTPAVGRYCWPATIGGLVLLGVGGDITIGSSVDLAQALEVPPTIIGLFMVAVGTSMPELITSTIAAIRGEADLALGNVVGSNLFNSLLVLPISAAITPVVVPSGGLLDLLLAFALAAAMLPLFLLGKAQLNRAIGVLLLLGYAAYAVVRVGQA